MYTSFFGLRELPFNNTPDPRFFYPTAVHEEALASLIYAVQERKGFVLLTGEVGAGKTLISRMMLRHFGGRIAFASISHALQSGRDLLESICTEFELRVDSGASNTQLTRILHDFLLTRFAEDIPVVLVVDEAQTMPIDAFEQVRMIGNLEADDAKLVQVAILGQPELQRMFASPALCQLRQRVFRSFHLPAMTRQETGEYIRHRLSVAGSTQLDIFDDQAVDRIYRHSAGIPRVTNALCDNCLLSSYSADQPKINAALIDSVVRQMMVFGDSVPALCAGAEGTVERERPPAHYPQLTKGAPARRAAASDSLPLVGIKNALTLLARDMRCNVEKVSRRLEALEKRAHPNAPALSGPADVDGKLAPLLERGRAQARELARREAKVRRLATLTKSLIEDAGRIFDRSRRTAEHTRQAEVTARSASRANRPVPRLDHESGPGQSSPSLIKEASMSIAEAGEGEKPGSVPGGDPAEFAQLDSRPGVSGGA